MVALLWPITVTLPSLALTSTEPSGIFRLGDVYLQSFRHTSTNATSYHEPLIMCMPLICSLHKLRSIPRACFDWIYFIRLPARLCTHSCLDLVTIEAFINHSFHATNSKPSSYIEDGYNITRTDAPKDLGGRLRLNCARTTPELPGKYQPWNPHHFAQGPYHVAG